VLSKIIPGLLFDLRSAGEAFEDMKQMGLSGASPLGEVKTKAPSSDVHNHRDVPSVAAQQAEVARDYLKRAARIDELNGHPPGSDGPMATALKRYLALKLSRLRRACTSDSEDISIKWPTSAVCTKR